MPIERLSAEDHDDAVPHLAALLIDAVQDNASVGFLAGLGQADATAFWREQLSDPSTVTFVARDEASGATGAVVGVVQLKAAAKPNQRHRADVAKLLVRRSARGRGLGSALMAAVEAEARRLDRWLLVLDTRTGSPAEAMYQRRGWQRVGTIDDYAADPDGTLSSCTFFSLRLDRVAEHRA